jgi:hypothetical protein
MYLLSRLSSSESQVGMRVIKRLNVFFSHEFDCGDAAVESTCEQISLEPQTGQTLLVDYDFCPH